MRLVFSTKNSLRAQRRKATHQASVRDGIGFSDKATAVRSPRVGEGVQVRPLAQFDAQLRAYIAEIRSIRRAEGVAARLIAPRIIKPLGSSVLPFVKTLFSKGTYEAAMGLVDDLREEERSALDDGEKWHARVIRVRCRLLLARMTFGGAARFAFRALRTLSGFTVQ